MHNSLFNASLSRKEKKTVNNLSATNRAVKVKDFLGNPTFEDFINALKKRNASCIRENYNNIAYFLRFLDSSNTLLNYLTLKDVKNFENLLLSKINLKEITKKTAYTKLSYLKKFLRYLYLNNIITFKYDIPPVFQNNKVTRDNEYVFNNNRLALIEAIFRKNSELMLRDLAIVLLLIETGCRPIEIAQLRIRDFNITESGITLYCSKSGQRNLHIHNTVKRQLKRYIDYRINVKAETEHLFLLEKLNPMNTEAIGGIINRYNKLAFGRAYFSAKSLRHTFITDSLNDRNDIHDVAKAVGHKHLVSTMHYFYRCLETLLANTLPYNPVKGIGDIV
ncbi:tyrosine-type recombinase/integrase [Paenibacillus wynnii]|uniref:tyrosine-type recombinase/integrase n=1 Tax=Paenibacillus wynnii TaxID=268407 RepID=UPI00279402A3|nr:site-specific integrase [Paenibacillus wynnii]MDQ0194922.1 integrase [Paenibacillus wynnii]